MSLTSFNVDTRPYSFIHGGLSGRENSVQYDEDYANIFVLSLPSFEWQRVPASTATMRSQHSCQVIGQSQMVVAGGDDPRYPVYGISQDPWKSALGIFDLSELQWSTGCDANAQAYSRPQNLINGLS